LTTKNSFRIGSCFALALRLLRRHWRKLLWLYAVLMLVPHVILGELSDTESEPLFGLFNGRFGDTDSMGQQLLGYSWDIPTALFYASALATMLFPDAKPWRTAIRTLPTIVLGLTGPAAIFAGLSGLTMLLLTNTNGLTPVLLLALQIANYVLYALYFVLAVYLFIACAAATERPNPLQAAARSYGLVRPSWFRVLILAAFVGLCSMAAQYGERVLLETFQTPDGTAFDWMTTVIQEILRSGYRFFEVALEVAACQLLVLEREGPSPATTAAVFD
jgi:hypothetical protein